MCGPTAADAPLPADLQHFNMVDDKELAPLQELIDQFTAGRIPTPL